MLGHLFASASDHRTSSGFCFVRSRFKHTFSNDRTNICFLCSTSLSTTANDFDPADEVKNLFKAADVAFVNLETASCANDKAGRSKCSGSSSCFSFRMPVSLLDELTASEIDVVSLANNHALDYQESCRADLEQRLNAKRIAWSGRPGTTARARRSRRQRHSYGNF